MECREDVKLKDDEGARWCAIGCAKTQPYLCMGLHVCGITTEQARQAQTQSQSRVTDRP